MGKYPVIPPRVRIRSLDVPACIVAREMIMGENA
jgi:hypothetical protein